MMFSIDFVKDWTPLNVFQFDLGRNLIGASIKPRLQRFQNDWDAGLKEFDVAKKENTTLPRIDTFIQPCPGKAVS